MVSLADPSRTTDLRKQAVARTLERFASLRRAVYVLVGTQNVFGIGQPPGTFVIHAAPAPGPNAWRFLTATEKVDAFRKWLDEQVKEKILSPAPNSNTRNVWLAGYVQSAYQRGVVREFTANKSFRAENNARVDTFFTTGSNADFLNQGFTARVGIKQLQLIATRSYSQLQGITADMDDKMTTILTNTLVHGKNPYVAAREMARTIDGITYKRAVTLARTEIINAQANGQLDAFEEMGVREIEMLAEFSNTGDKRVCPICSKLGGRVYTIEEARGIIPVHPNCRCAWKRIRAGSHRSNTAKRLTPGARAAVKRANAA